MNPASMISLTMQSFQHGLIYSVVATYHTLSSYNRGSMIIESTQRLYMTYLPSPISHQLSLSEALPLSAVTDILHRSP